MNRDASFSKKIDIENLIQITNILKRNLTELTTKYWMFGRSMIICSPLLKRQYAKIRMLRY